MLTYRDHLSLGKINLLGFMESNNLIHKDSSSKLKISQLTFDPFLENKKGWNSSQYSQNGYN